MAGAGACLGALCRCGAGLGALVAVGFLGGVCACLGALCRCGVALGALVAVDFLGGVCARLGALCCRGVALGARAALPGALVAVGFLGEAPFEAGARLGATGLGLCGGPVWRVLVGVATVST